MTIDRCEHAARAGGLAAGLSEALSGIDPARAASGPVIAVVGTAADRPRIPHGPAEAEGISFVRIRPQHDAREAATFAGRLAHARIGLSAVALATASGRLAARRGGDEPIVRKQLVVGDIADCSLEIQILRQQAGIAARSPDPATAADLHRALDMLDWRIARLFGASGYTGDDEEAEPCGAALYVSMLVAQTWIGRTETRAWN
jgi:hypothetical protein